MTICLGSLLQPQTEDSRSVAAAMRGKIAELHDRQHVELRVVSVGRGEGVLAVGVFSGVSCNRNPHVTVACAPRVAPSAANLIRTWDPLPPHEQFTIRGEVEQRGKGFRNVGKSSVAPPKDEAASRIWLGAHRREELVAMVLKFVVSAETKMTFPASLAGPERKFVHQEAEKHACSAQSYPYGRGNERVLILYKGTRFRESAVLDHEASADGASHASGSDVEIERDSASRTSDNVTGHGFPSGALLKPIGRQKRDAGRRRGASDVGLPGESRAVDAALPKAEAGAAVASADAACVAACSPWCDSLVVEVTLPDAFGFLELPVLLRSSRTCRCWATAASSLQVELRQPQAIRVLRFCLVEVLYDFDDDRFPLPLSAIYGDMCKVARRAYAADGHAPRLASFCFGTLPHEQAPSRGGAPHHVSWHRACGDLRQSGLKTLEKMGRFFQAERLIDVSLQRWRKRIHKKNLLSCKEWLVTRANRQHPAFNEHAAWRHSL